MAFCVAGVHAWVIPSDDKLAVLKLQNTRGSRRYWRKDEVDSHLDPLSTRRLYRESLNVDNSTRRLG